MTTRRMIHIVDDEESIRRSAGFMLKTAGFSVSTYPSGVAFLREVRHAEPGCILLDVRMPEMDGLEVQQALRERGVVMPVIILTGHGDISIAVRAMKAGAVEFIEKPFEKAVMLDAIAAAFERLDDSGRRAARAADAAVMISALTGREQDVLKGLADGLPNKTIAYDLGISPRTVEVHRANLMAKLGVRSLSDALRIAFAANVGQGS
ncbi:response regulator [Sphingomonas histidinilytica]|uniref:response regulator transcription factor n=1 Tax=Sphingomonadales TaxID=204457 RepID=UPI0007704324|nr:MULTISPECIES: response regulator [Sphingomonadaceae]AMK22905.1 LuxR family two component transcriptional regulator [Sphingobium sp. TKS]MBO9380696.1 response regulator [Rhizorhabdus histidinilytica]MCF8706644.1 response regulator [Rhizorhapis sp. SPR117]